MSDTKVRTVRVMNPLCGRSSLWPLVTVIRRKLLYICSARGNYFNTCPHFSPFPPKKDLTHLHFREKMLLRMPVRRVLRFPNMERDVQHVEIRMLMVSRADCFIINCFNNYFLLLVVLIKPLLSCRLGMMISSERTPFFAS